MLVLHRPASETSRNVSQAGRWWCQSWTPPLTPRMNAYQKSLETVFSIAICRHCGDKLQFKTLLPTILSTFVDRVDVLDCHLSDEPPSYLLSLLDWIVLERLYLWVPTRCRNKFGMTLEHSLSASNFKGFKYAPKRVSFGSKDCTKEPKPGRAHLPRQTSQPPPPRPHQTSKPKSPLCINDIGDKMQWLNNGQCRLLISLIP